VPAGSPGAIARPQSPGPLSSSLARTLAPLASRISTKLSSSPLGHALTVTLAVSATRLVGPLATTTLTTSTSPAGLIAATNCGAYAFAVAAPPLSSTSVASSAQAALHPSLASRLPSSHASVGSWTPSPQEGTRLST
jgi:hypothetical protein